MAKPINCFKCKHFYITWDRVTPKGCRAYGFKSHEMPSVVVHKNSKEDCLLFEAKPEKKKNKLDDLNSDDLW